jgi:6-phospho-beta-glucosidase
LKIALLGGAGTRVPLVVSGLLRSRDELRCDELALWDPDRERQAAIATVGEAMVRRAGTAFRITVADRAESAIAGADFILCSIRVGGATGRITDERIALAHGLLGQETIGPGGWAMALRSIPAVLEYARLAERVAPRAWLLNFTNPVGIVLQALVAAGVQRAIGICDTPREMFENAARELGIESQCAFFDYFGLNHLGWVRRILVHGEDLLPRLLAQPEKVARIYHVPLFNAEYLSATRLLPTEYLYFYLHADEAAAQIKRAGSTRGEAVAEQEQRLFAALATSNGDSARMLERYDDYLAERQATYFLLETGESVSELDVAHARSELYQKAAGYDRVAVDVMRAIAGNRRAVFPVDVANQGAIVHFAANDAVEVPCEIDQRGARPLPVGSVPETVRPLLTQVKEYERLTAQASLSGSLSMAAEALRANPLVGERVDAIELARHYREAHRDLGYLR